eukprot:TRINITY_DN92799_c0_g1_i1.p1 TRINITY_DN92799_c0_g1~~TRINITY_DN92799_c0_g1_i1.p1  ORF type:complete len:195 (-),score=45.83 TRINITY_DN92799_c0_g1_i1:98-682(-)
MSQNENVLFLNILVVQKGYEAIKKSVSQSIPNALGFDAVHNVAGEVVARMVSENGLAASLAAKLPEVLPLKMAELGVHVAVETHFRKGSFLALKVTVLSADLDHLNAQRFLTVSDIFQSCTGCNSVEADVTSKLIDILPEKLPEKMAEEGVVVEIIAMREEDEADYLAVVNQILNTKATREYCTPASVPGCSLQ